MNAMNDTLDFVKKLWGGMQVPGMITPSLSVDELDKKIRDLKTVESWLNVNMNMLRGTIQALEVQRATIAALKAMGETFAQGAVVPDFADLAARAQKSATAWPMPAESRASQQEEKAQPVEQAEEPAEEPAAEPGAPVGEPDQPKPKRRAKPQAAQAGSQEEGGSSFASPAAWWNLLQDQFKQAVSNAMSGDTTLAHSSQKTAKQAEAAKPAKAAANGKRSGATPKEVVGKTAAGKTAAAKKSRAVPPKATKAPRPSPAPKAPKP